MCSCHAFLAHLPQQSAAADVALPGGAGARKGGAASSRRRRICGSQCSWRTGEQRQRNRGSSQSCSAWNRHAGASRHRGGFDVNGQCVHESAHGPAAEGDKTRYARAHDNFRFPDRNRSCGPGTAGEGISAALSVAEALLV